MNRRLSYGLVAALLLAGLAGCKADSSPPAIVAEGWEGTAVESVCLTVSGTYEPEFDSRSQLPVEAAARRVLRGVGLQVLGEGADCDADLSIDYTAVASTESYISAMGDCGGDLWEGVHFFGTVTLTSGDHEGTWRFDKQKMPSLATSACRRNPEDAPFYVIWGRAIVEPLMEIWGPQVAIVAVNDRDEDVARGGIVALEALPYIIPGEEVDSTYTEAVPGLIGALDTITYGLNDTALELLVTITGEDFGLDQNRWRLWQLTGR